MLLLLQLSFGEIGLICLGAVFLRSPLAAQNNFDLCLFFLHGSIKGAVLTSWASLKRIFMQSTHCGKHPPPWSIAMKPYSIYSGLYFRFDMAKNYLAN